ncbi:MAG: hypothetical protein ACOYVF_02185 [Candidatus Zixiibacteriota bacterium]
MTPSFIRAGEHQSEILQYKIDRFYFSSGVEENIFTGSRFVVIQNDDTLYQGKIEASYPGVSYSEITERNFEKDLLDNFIVFIETADSDSGAVIHIGLNVIDSLLARLIFNDTASSLTNPVNLIYNPALDKLATLLETGRLDMLISYDSSLFPIRESSSLSAPAPYFAALVPNLGRNVTTGGMLATSLYYRYSSFYLPFMFEGDRVEPVYSFFRSDGFGHRTYPFDPDKGAKLFKNNIISPAVLTLGVNSPSLRKSADFFADILARDRVQVKIVEHDTDADFFIMFVPLETVSPQYSLSYIYRFLTGQVITDDAVKENLTIIGDYLESAAKAADTAACYHYCRLADRNLKNDLGVFPLFRPTLFLTASHRLKNCAFDAAGHIKTATIDKLILPTDRTEVTP